MKKIISILNTSSNTYVLMMKKHMLSSSFYIGNILIPFFCSLCLGIFFPFSYSAIWIFFISLTFSTFASYGTLFFTIKKSTMMKNIEITNNETITLYFATFWVLLSTSFLTIFVDLIFSYFFNYIELTTNKFIFLNDINMNYNYIQYSEIWWNLLVYYWITQTLLIFSLSFFIEQILKTQKNFFIFVFTYILGGIVFSGIFSSTLSVNSDTFSVQVVTKDIFENWNQTERQGYVEKLLWGSPMWKISQLWPHYGLNQICFNIIESGSYYYGEGNEKIFSIWHNIRFIDIKEIDLHVVYYFVMPWIWIIIPITIASFLKKYKKN